MSNAALSKSTADELPELSSTELHKRLDELHQLIYRRGGIRPVNAAIEELAKLLLLELKLRDDADCRIPKLGPLFEILDSERISNASSLASVKDAFRHVNQLPEYAGRLPDGSTQPIWPADEPLRIDNPEVVGEAIRILRPHLRSTNPDDFDVIGTAFDVFLRGRYEHSGGLGTHLTPHAVTTALARICLTGLDVFSGPLNGPVIGDPCCGTGRFLIAAVNELSVKAKPKQLNTFLESGLVGADQSSSAVAKARINLLLAGAQHPNVFTVQDSIIDPKLDVLRGRLRLILTNPPFGEGKYDSAVGIERIGATFPSLGEKRRIDPALAFVARCLELLQDGGRLGIVLPDGLVDGPSLQRALLGTSSARLKDVSVEANISLPTATFALAGTVAKTSALVLRKQAARHSQIFLARAEHVGFLKQGAGSIPDPKGDDLPAIADAAIKVLSRKLVDTKGDVKFVSRVPLAATVPAQEATTLDPARVDPDAVEARKALRDNGVLLRDLLRPVKRRQRQTTALGVPFVSVLHIDDLGVVAWHRARDYNPSTPGREARSGNLLVSLLNPRKLRATVVPSDPDVILCSSEFGVFEALGDPYEALVLLHHPLVKAQLSPLGRGTSSSRRRITPDDLLDIYVPSLPTQKLSPIAAKVRKALDQAQSASVTIATAYSKAAT